MISSQRSMTRSYGSRIWESADPAVAAFRGLCVPALQRACLDRREALAGRATSLPAPRGLEREAHAGWAENRVYPAGWPGWVLTSWKTAGPANRPVVPRALPRADRRP